MMLNAFWLVVAGAVVLAAGLVAERGAWPRSGVPVALAGAALILHGEVQFSLSPLPAVLHIVVNVVAPYPTQQVEFLGH